MTEREIADALLTVADDKLLPVTWRLRWLLDQLPPGRSRDVVETALRQIEIARASMTDEAAVLNRYPEADE